MRQVVLDTETTGLEVGKGHRIIEIGCVELLERRPTGRSFHRYINPDRAIDEGAQAVHGISLEFLSDKPRFADIADELLAFIDGAELLAHNANFDVGFIDAELALTGRRKSLREYADIIDTLALARELYPGQRNGLDALCKRLGIDNSHRELHGALLDAQLLAEVYLGMTAGQGDLGLEAGGIAGNHREGLSMTTPSVELRLRIVRASETEHSAHARRIAALDKSAKGESMWTRLGWR